MNNKKILDIIPPQKFEKERKEIIKEVPVEKIKKPSKFPIGKILILIFIFLIIGGSVFYFRYSKANVEIQPQTNELNFTEKIEINSAVEKIDFNSRVIPGKIFEFEKQVSQNFTSSGKVLKKAEGTIRIYNEYQKDQVLIKNTRFISTNGKLFYSKNKISIPTGKYTDVGVIAAQPGSEYNIDPSVFSIPGLSGMPQYYSITGKSFSPMTGGGEVAVVLQEDLDKAKNTLTEKLLEEVKNYLKEETKEDFILPDEAISQEINEVSGPKAGDEVESFDLSLNGKIQGLSFKKSDLESFAKEFILSQTPNDKKFQEESLKTNWTVESTESKPKKISLNLEFGGKIYSAIDENTLKESIAGKSLKDAEVFFTSLPQIIDFQVKFCPPFLSKFPEDINRIKIKLNID
jgi:hypothetical protein